MNSTASTVSKCYLAYLKAAKRVDPISSHHRKKSYKCPW